MRPIHRHRPYVVRGNCHSRPLARAQFLVLPCRRRHRSVLLRRLRLRAIDFNLFCDFSILPLSLSPFLLWILVSRRGFSRPTSRRPGANLVLTHRPLSSLPLSAAVRQFWCHDRWYERYWPYIADAIGYAVMITARLHSLSPPHSLPRFGSTPALRQPGRKVGLWVGVRLGVNLAPLPSRLPSTSRLRLPCFLSIQPRERAEHASRIVKHGL